MLLLYLELFRTIVKVIRSCLTLPPHGLYSPWNSPGQNPGVGSLSLLQGIFPTQGSNPGLPHGRWILYPLSHQGSPNIFIHLFKIFFLGVYSQIVLLNKIFIFSLFFLWQVPMYILRSTQIAPCLWRGPVVLTPPAVLCLFWSTIYSVDLEMFSLPVCFLGL